VRQSSVKPRTVDSGASVKHVAQMPTSIHTSFAAEDLEQ
jgi:hypothetical protein